MVLPPQDPNDNRSGSEKNNVGEGQCGADSSSHNSYTKRRRADKRKGDRGKAADIVERSRNYYRERRVALVTNLSGQHALDSSNSSSSRYNEQYRIPPPDDSGSILDAFFLLCSLAFEDLASWVYAASFWMVLLFFLALYFLFVWIFVGFLLAADPTSRCIVNNDILEEEPTNMRHVVEFAFALSWTTFTTVGYGAIAPPGDDDGCYAVRFICSIEAIMGMGFVSMCSGIFYAKLLRFIGSAPVTFSSTVCVRYGKGLTDNFALSLGEDEEPDGDRFNPGILSPSFGRKRQNYFNQYPILEFRIVNNRANCPPGKNEIWDAQVTAILELPKENCDTTERRNSIPSDKNSTNKTICCDLILSPSFHPYFCRTWFLRHVLDESSPLLKEEVRTHLKERGRKGWDAKLNNYRDIRNGLVEFTSIRIMMSGSSALSKGEVYAEKTYTYDDVFIGWKFVAVCFEGDETNSSGFFRRSKRRSGSGSAKDTKTRVDLSLMHDICPQKGANYEPMVADDKAS